MAIQSPAVDIAAALVRPTVASAARGYWPSVGRRLRRDPVTLICAAVLLVLVLSSVFAPLLGLADPYKTSMIRRLYPLGSPNHLLGTDELGRDMFARLIYGGRLSLFMGVMPVLCALLIGGTLGIIAGFVGGKVNMAIMRVMDVFYAFPSVLLAISLSGALGAGTENTLLSLTLVFIPPICRVSESVTTQVRGFDFVDAARASGASAFTIVRVHVLGNVLGPILVYATSLISVAIILAAGLSFLGLGVKPPEPEWGLMLNTLRQAIDDPRLGVSRRRAEEDGERKSEERGGNGQDDGVAERRRHFGRHRPTRPDRGAEIACQRDGKPAEVLDWQRLVEAIVLLELVDDFLGGVGRDDGRDRIARRQVDQREDEQRHAEGDRHQIKQSSERVEQHAARPSPLLCHLDGRQILEPALGLYEALYLGAHGSRIEVVCDVDPV